MTGGELLERYGPKAAETRGGVFPMQRRCPHCAAKEGRRHYPTCRLLADHQSTHAAKPAPETPLQRAVRIVSER